MSQRTFNYVKLTVNFITGHLIQWSLNPAFKASLPYQFFLQASQTIDFSELVFEKICNDTFYAVDDTKIKQNNSRDWFYRVKLITGDGQCYYSESLYFDSSPAISRRYMMAAEIMRRTLVWCNQAGHQGFLLKRKTYGEIDVPNVDPVTGTARTDNVGDYGTGLVGGYFNPVSIPFVVDTSSRDRQLAQDGMSTKETNDITIRTVGFPNIDTNDIIVQSDNNRRYNVLGISSNQMPGTTIQVVQRASLRLLPLSNNVYQIPVP